MKIQFAHYKPREGCGTPGKCWI